MNTQLFATLLVPTAFFSMWLVEHVRPARPYVAVSGWSRVGVVSFVGVAVLGSLTPLLWATLGVSSLRVLDLSGLGWGGFPVGLLVGWFLPRPEMHALHHAFGVHGRNYGDLPLWDALFGTYANPSGPVAVQVGFEPDASARLGDMLLMRDVNAPRGTPLPAIAG